MPEHHSVTADHSLTQTASSDDYDFLSHISHSRFALLSWPELINSPCIGLKLCFADKSCFYQDLYVGVQLESQLGLRYWRNYAIYWRKNKKEVLPEMINMLSLKPLSGRVFVGAWRTVSLKGSFAAGEESKQRVLASAAFKPTTDSISVAEIGTAASLLADLQRI